MSSYRGETCKILISNMINKIAEGKLVRNVIQKTQMMCNLDKMHDYIAENLH